MPQDLVQVSVLLSSQSGRYRLQSDVFSALWLPLDALLGAGGPWGLVEPLPLGDVMTAVDSHLQLHRGLQECYRVIDQQCVHAVTVEKKCTSSTHADVCFLTHRSMVYRLTQQRLIAVYKDVTPCPLKHLDVLLDECHAALQFAGARPVAINARVEKFTFTHHPH